MYDTEKCIICQKKTKIPLSSTENGRQKIIDAANKRRDEVYKRLKSSNIERPSKYRMTNDYYKTYTLKKTENINKITWIGYLRCFDSFQLLKEIDVVMSSFGITFGICFSQDVTCHTSQ